MQIFSFATTKVTHMVIFPFWLSCSVVGKDALDVATEKEFDECKDIVSKALEKRDLKPTLRPNTQKQPEEPQKPNPKR